MSTVHAEVVIAYLVAHITDPSILRKKIHSARFCAVEVNKNEYLTRSDITVLLQGRPEEIERLLAQGKGPGAESVTLSQFQKFVFDHPDLYPEHARLLGLASDRVIDGRISHDMVCELLGEEPGERLCLIVAVVPNYGMQQSALD